MKMTNDRLLDVLCLLGELIFCNAKKLTVVLSLGQGHHHMPETRGLCLSEEQTVSTVRMFASLCRLCFFLPYNQ